MDKALSLVIGQFTIYGIFIASILVLVPHLDKILALISHFSRRKFHDLKELINEKNDDNTNEVIKDIYDSMRFQRATGIYVEKLHRDNLIRFYQEDLRGMYNWKQIKSVLAWLNFDESGITIRYSKFEHWLFRISMFVMAIGMFFSMAVLLSKLENNTFIFKEDGSLLMIGFSCPIMGILMLLLINRIGLVKEMEEIKKRRK